MKNKFLFLSATALLSTGALLANAENPTADMASYVKIMSGENFDVTQGMFFGAWHIPSSIASKTTSLTFSMDSMGDVEVNNENVSQISASHYGITEGAPCDILDFPSSVSLSDVPAGATATLSGIKAQEIFTEDDDYNINLKCAIYADSLVIENTSGIGSHTYGGKFTITAILDSDGN